MDAACLLRLEGIGDVELKEFAGAPRGDIELLVIERKVDVGDEGRHRLEAFEEGRQLVLGSRLCRNLDHLLDLVRGAVEVPYPDRCAEVLQAGDDADKAIGL